MNLQALRIKNLRCLGDTGKVPIKPITILVGRNSSGKSTFLRTFPLLRQSVETSTESPILWYHQRYVDFGSLQEAIGARNAGEGITFDFSVKLPKSKLLTLGDLVFDIGMTLTGGEPPRGAHVQSYDIRVEDNQVQLQFAPDGVLQKLNVNGADLLPRSVALVLDGPAFLIPSLQVGTRGKVSYRPAMPSFLPESIKYRSRARSVLLQGLMRALRAFLHGNTSDQKVKAFASSLRIGTRDAMLSQFKALDGGNYFDERARHIKPDSRWVLSVVNHTIAAMVPFVLEALDQEIAEFMARANYLAPLRATAERSYRIQDLSVGEVDPRGDNLAMFLRSLSTNDVKSFASFTHEHLGFESSVRATGIHAEILVKESDEGKHMNLVDVGFGYSQVLPLTAILWSTCCRDPSDGRTPTSLLAIEQPELHLHPAHQAKLAQMLVGAYLESRKADREVRLVVETHSEALVNGLGMLIHEGKLNASDAQIVLFDQDAATRQTIVRLAGYDDDGALCDWPFGFFAPVADD